MRKLLIATASLLALLAGMLPAAGVEVSALGAADRSADLAQEPLGPGGFQSDNIAYHGTLAVDSTNIGGRVHVMPDGERRFYQSGAQGLSIYNIDNPAVPVLLGRLQIPNFENEDVSVSADGKTVLMSEFTGSFYLYVFSVTDRLTPTGQVAITLEGQMLTGGAHISDCIDDACDVAYGSEGQIYDLSDKSAPEEVGSWKDAISEQAGFRPGGGHNVEVLGDYDLDGDGDLERVLTTDTTPIVMLDVTDALKPRYIAQSEGTDHTTFGTRYQHNNKIQNFEDYVPRGQDDEPVAYDPETGLGENLRTGEILMGNGETNFSPLCNSGSGPLASWSVAGWEQQDRFQTLDVFRPENGTYDGDGDPAAAAVGCSGHWFDTRNPTASELASGAAAPGDFYVAAGWYEHGTRVFHIDGTSGEISQVAYFQPVNGSSFAAHWVVEGERTFIYTVDLVRGADILAFDGTGEVPSFEDRALSWTLADVNMAAISDEARYACQLAVPTA